MSQISIIVPVYKVEKYLPACVDSILVQTFADFELILVDDGSPDHCGMICDEYAKRDQRIRVIHQENQGLSGARNSGIDIAKGEYITFIDSDDIVSYDFLEILYLELKKNNATVSCCKLQNFEDGNFVENIFNSILSHCTKVMSGQEAVLSIYNATGDVGITACGKLFLKALFEGNRFPIGKIHEDQALIPIVLCGAEKVVSVNRYIYYYRCRSDSIMHMNFEVKRFDNIEAIDSCINYFRIKGYNKLTTAAKKTRKKVNALLVIQADSSGAHDLIPKKYYLTKIQALYYCYKYASNDTYSWYLAKLYPKAVIFHEYHMKVKSILRRLCGK